MIEPVSQRTYDRIAALERTETIAGVRLVWCPCRLLPETVLNLKGLMTEIDRLWSDTLGEETYAALLDSPEGADFFTGRVRIVEVQAGRPDMVAVWLPVPPDYPRRMKVQLVDGVEPFELP